MQNLRDVGVVQNLIRDVLQIEYSLLKRDAELSGLLGKCKELGVTPIAHSPLSQGLLTDFALEREDSKVKSVKPLLQLLQFIGAVSGGKAIEQVLPQLLTAQQPSVGPTYYRATYIFKIVLDTIACFCACVNAPGRGIQVPSYLPPLHIGVPTANPDTQTLHTAFLRF